MGEQSIPVINCLPCAQNGVLSGVVMQEEELINLAVPPNPSNYCFNFFNVCTCLFLN